MTPDAPDAGAFRAAIGLATEPDGPSEAITALVDTGATYTLVPAPILRRLGVEPIGRQTFLIADGSRVEREIGEVTILLGDRRRTTVVVFGDDGAEPLLGAVTMEEFGLGVDPVRRRLVPVDGYLVGLRPEATGATIGLGAEGAR